MVWRLMRRSDGLAHAEEWSGEYAWASTFRVWEEGGCCFIFYETHICYNSHIMKMGIVIVKENNSSWRAGFSLLTAPVLALFFAFSFLALPAFSFASNTNGTIDNTS